MPTFFFRNKDMKGPPTFFELSRIVGGILHLCIPVIVYHILYKDLLSQLSFTKDWNFVELHPNRKKLYMILDIYYAVRWSLGCFIMNSKLTTPIAIIVSMKHLVCDELGYVVSSMLVTSYGYNPGSHVERDYICAIMMIVAGILQHYSEIQRYIFKLNPNNRGKIHTDGLFSLARGINHTGHVLRDIAHVILSPNLFLIMIYLLADYDLVFEIFPETQVHMKTKYGDQWTKYETQTPYRFIPGIY